MRNDSYALVSLDISLSPMVSTMVMTHSDFIQEILDIIVKIGGMLSICFFVFRPFGSAISRKLYTVSLINELFKYKEDEQIEEVPPLRVSYMSNGCVSSPVRSIENEDGSWWQAKPREKMKNPLQFPTIEKSSLSNNIFCKDMQFPESQDTLSFKNNVSY